MGCVHAEVGGSSGELADPMRNPSQIWIVAVPHLEAVDSAEWRNE